MKCLQSVLIYKDEKSYKYKVKAVLENFFKLQPLLLKWRTTRKIKGVSLFAHCCSAGNPLSPPPGRNPREREVYHDF